MGLKEREVLLGHLLHQDRVVALGSHSGMGGPEEITKSGKNVYSTINNKNTFPADLYRRKKLPVLSIALFLYFFLEYFKWCGQTVLSRPRHLNGQRWLMVHLLPEAAALPAVLPGPLRVPNLVPGFDAFADLDDFLLLAPPFDIPSFKSPFPPELM